MQETKITKARIKHHFSYSWWKYVLLACVAVFGWNLFYTTTAYRAPREKRLDVYFVAPAAAPQGALDWLRDEILTRYADEIEDSNVYSITYNDEDYYGAMQLTTYMGAGEGDVFFLPRERFSAVGEGSGFVLLEGEVDTEGMDVSAGMLTNEEGQKALYGIPTDSLYGLMELGIDNRGLVACIMPYSPNQERAIDWLNWFVETMKADKPDWVAEEEAKLPDSGAETSDISSF